MEGAGAHLHVVGLEDDAALVGPEALEPQDQVLKGRRGLPPLGFLKLGHVDFGGDGISRARYSPEREQGKP